MLEISIKKTLSRFIIRYWPFSFAHVKLINMVDPPQLPCDLIVTKLKGFPLRIRYNPNTYIGRYLYYRGTFEEEVLRKMEQLLRPGMVFLDVGANIGLHTIVAANCVGSTGKVISVEPQSKVNKLLHENVNLNKLENTMIFKCALGRESAKMELYQISADNNGQATLASDAKNDACEVEVVDVKPLRELLELGDVERIDVVKMDVEGAEYEVLLGAKDVFEKSWPGVMFIECIDTHLKRFNSSSKELVSFLIDNGYEVYVLERGRWVQLDSLKCLNADIVAIQKRFTAIK